MELLVEELPGWAKFRPYQREGAQKLISDQARLLWATTGAGKTAMLLAAWGGLGLSTPALFLSKAIGRYTIPRDAAWVLGKDYVPGILFSGAQRGPGVHDLRGRRSYTSLDRALLECYGVSTNYDVLEPRFQELAKVPWKLFVMDEAHEIKGGYQRPKKDRNGKLHLLRYHWARKLADMVRARGGWVLESTATPIVDRRRDLFAQLDIAYPNEFGTAWKFLHRFCDARPGEYGGLDSSGMANSDELMGMIRDRAVLISRAAIASQLPAVQRDVCLVSPNVESYARMGGGLETALDRAAELTMPFVLDEAAEYLTGKLKVIMITTRRRFAYEMAQELTSKRYLSRLPRHVRKSIWSACVTGEVDPGKRTAIVEEFNGLNNGPAWLVATIKSVGSSMDIHRVHGMLIGAFPDRPGDLIQLEGRVGRLSGWPMTIKYLVAERTVAEKYKEMLFDKLEDASYLGTDTQGEGGAFQALGTMGTINEERVLAGLRAFLEEEQE